MAFDGVTIACVISELKKELIGGRLYKIAQPENDELLLTIKQPTGQKRLLLSASASLPLIYLTETNKPSPMTAPNFCFWSADQKRFVYSLRQSADCLFLCKEIH